MFSASLATAMSSSFTPSGAVIPLVCDRLSLRVPFVSLRCFRTWGGSLDALAEVQSIRLHRVGGGGALRTHGQLPIRGTPAAPLKHRAVSMTAAESAAARTAGRDVGTEAVGRSRTARGAMIDDSFSFRYLLSPELKSYPLIAKVGHILLSIVDD